MKIFLCVADIHCQIKKEVPVVWQINRYKELFTTLISLCKEHAADLIITGDTFERSEPELEELQLVMEFFRHLKEEKITTYLVGGNHETISKNISTLDFLDIGKDKTIDVHYKSHGWYLEVPEEKATFWFLNHSSLADPQWETPDEKPKGLNILISHFRCNLGYHIKEEIDVEGLLQSFDLAVCGDIHCNHEEGKLIYTNQPINKEFQQSPETGVLLLTLDDGTFKTKRIKTSLPALIQRNCNCVEFATLEINARDFYRVEVTGTLPELRLLTAPANVRLVKQPLVENVLTEVEEEAKELVETTLDVDLMTYMSSLKYSESKIDRMMAVWGEV